VWNWTMCPEQYRGGLQRYFEHHVEPGSFLRAVLENDLMGAMAAFDWSGDYRGLVEFLYCEVPSRRSGLWGSAEAVAAWLAKDPAVKTEELP
jgi:hypothetical protein